MTREAGQPGKFYKMKFNMIRNIISPKYFLGIVGRMNVVSGNDNINRVLAFGQGTDGVGSMFLHTSNHEGMNAIGYKKYSQLVRKLYKRS
jgi:hypothetical protein